MKRLITEKTRIKNKNIRKLKNMNLFKRRNILKFQDKSLRFSYGHALESKNKSGVKGQTVIWEMIFGS